MIWQEQPFFENHKWVLRVIFDSNLYFYLDGPLDGIDDGSANDIINWESYADNTIYQFGDYCETLDAFKGKRVFKQSVRKNDTSYAYYYHTPELKSKSIIQCKYQISFQGSLLTWKHRPRMLDVLKTFDSYAFQPLSQFWWNVDKDKRKELYKSYCELLDDTQFFLCPRGKGLNSVRFFETLRMGRIPVLISDEAKLPLEWLIDYSKFVVKVPENDLLQTKKYVDAFIRAINVEEASLLAKETSLKYFQDADYFEGLHL
jgi:hypothetical protein